MKRFIILITILILSTGCNRSYCRAGGNCHIQTNNRWGSNCVVPQDIIREFKSTDDTKELHVQIETGNCKVTVHVGSN